MGRRIKDVSAKESAEICELYLAGEPVVDIGRTYDLSGGLVSDIAKAAGLPPRQRRASRALEEATVDLKHLQVEDIDGEARVVDTALGAALGYERPRKIRELIERLMPQLAELGGLPHRGANPHELGGRPTIEYLLNLKQINYLITRCGLPRADEWCVHIATVFTAWQEGRLRTDRLDDAVDIQDSAEAAAEAAPQISALTKDMVRELQDILKVELKAETSHLATRDQLTSVQMDVRALQHRQAPKPETKRQFSETIVRFYGGLLCPCCADRPVLLPDGTVVGQYDHWTDNRSKNGAHEMWLVCAPCNKAFEHRDLDRANCRSDFDKFQKYRRKVLSDRQPIFDGFSVEDTSQRHK